MSGHLKAHCNLTVPWKYLSLSEHPIGIAKVAVTAEHPSARFHSGKGPLTHCVHPCPQRVSKIWPCSCFQGVRPSCTQLHASRHMAEGIFPVKREKKKASQHSVSSQRPFKNSGRFSSEVFFFTAREVLGLISYMWQAESVTLHLPMSHQVKPIPEPVCCTFMGIDVT